MASGQPALRAVSLSLALAPARLLRRSFQLTEAPRSVRRYVAALSGYWLWFNGHRVGDVELQTGRTDYRHHLPYRAYDVGPFLRGGENVVGALVGGGLYASCQALDGRYAVGPAPRRLRLMLEARDGAGRLNASASDGQ